MGEIMEYLLVASLFAVTGFAMFFLNRLQMNAQKKTTYVCNQCSDNYCECIQE